MPAREPVLHCKAGAVSSVVERLFDVEDVGSSTLSPPTNTQSNQSLSRKGQALFHSRFAVETRMELTPRRQQLIDAHVAESHARMADHAFELNDLVRFALSAAKQKAQKAYYPMDPVNECIRQWDALAKKLAKLAASIEQDRARLGVPPFDAESAADQDAPPRSAP